MKKALAKIRGPFDESPIRFGDTHRIELVHHEARIQPGASDDELSDALRFATSAAESSPYWVGDLVAFTEDRDDAKDRASQILAVTGIAPHTLDNLASISRRVKPSERELAASISHSEVVAKMPRAEQRRWLIKARDEGWKLREFRLEVKASQKRGRLDAVQDLTGFHRTWLIDFPWKYGDAQPSGISAQTHYPGMTLAEGLAWAETVRDHTTVNAVSFWWVTAPFLYYATDPSLGPDPYRIIRAAGFEPKTGMVWDKVEHNVGHYVSIRHEHLIIATRGEGMTPDRPVPMADSVFTERKSPVHSEKPKAIAAMIERLYDGPYVEMFARDTREGWTTWGNQVNTFPAAGKT
jgi:N6-adenosine-specific RNA methylase IME4